MNWRVLIGVSLVGLLFACGGDDGAESGPQECGGQTVLCDGMCVDPTSDSLHCGECGQACTDGTFCIEGSCAAQCPPAQDACGDVCASLDTSREHCGACDNPCDAGDSCIGGSCQLACPEGQTICGDTCASIETSREHCGGCDQACTAGSVCADGACSLTCPQGQSDCDGGCHDTDASDQHCGGCGLACDAGTACLDGACVPACPDSLVECDGSCRSVDSDRAHCGGCGLACGTGEICSEGACLPGCPAEMEICDGTCRQTATDPSHCGACGTVCGSDEVCFDGACSLLCSSFDSELCGGACTNTAFDRQNCGACGAACAAGEVCNGGACAGICDAAYASCADGCTSLDNDPDNCGACGQACAVGTNANPACAAGSCELTCAPGWADCNYDLALPGGDGCEVSLNDVDNCGGCGVVCASPPNAAGICINESCAISSCEFEWADCDGDPGNGCEVERDINSLHCGVCGQACTAGQVCIAGACGDPGGGESCAAPFQLASGLNLIHRRATAADHFTAAPSCDAMAPAGGDLVLRYDATFTGTAEVLLLEKLTGARWHIVVSDAPCGALSGELACNSVAATEGFGVSFDVVTGNSYFVYLVGTSSGHLPADRPLPVQLSEYDCATHAPATVTTTPPDMGSYNGIIEATFDMPIQRSGVTVTLSTTGGTSLVFDDTSPALSLSADKHTLRLAPGTAIANNAQITVTWSGLNDAICNRPIQPPTWSFDVPPACRPGNNGIVGNTITRFPTGSAGLLSVNYVAADANPNGYVYVGESSSLYRMPKSGGTLEAVHVEAQLTSLLGFHMAIDGDNIYITSSKTTTELDGYVHRITTDGGASWNVVDMVRFPLPPNGMIKSLAAQGGSVFLLTHQSSTTSPTQIWSSPTAGALPANATLAWEFGANTYSYCGGLVVDSQHFYTNCLVNSSFFGAAALLRIDRITGTVTEVVQYPASFMNILNMAVQGSDTDGDGAFDVFYYNAEVPSAAVACEVDGTPYHNGLYNIASTQSWNFGLGFDPVANALWDWDTLTNEFVRID